MFRGAVGPLSTLFCVVDMYKCSKLSFWLFVYELLLWLSFCSTRYNHVLGDKTVMYVWLALFSAELDVYISFGGYPPCIVSTLLFPLAGEGSEGFAKDRNNFLLSASNQLDMEEWMTKIRHVIASVSHPQLLSVVFLIIIMKWAVFF